MQMHISMQIEMYFPPPNTSLNVHFGKFKTAKKCVPNKKEVQNFVGSQVPVQEGQAEMFLTETGNNQILQLSLPKMKQILIGIHKE